MISTVTSFTHYLRTYPLRAVLTLVTIALGVGALTITFGLSFDVNETLNESLSRNGRRITIANAARTDDGELERQFPPAFDQGVPELLVRDYENLRDAAIVGDARWARISAAGTSYQIRSASAVTAGYAALMNLELLAGSFLTDRDVVERRQVVVMSASAARMLFGSAGAAVGEQIRTAIPVVNTDEAEGGRFRMSQQPFAIVGVFADPSELEREAYGISDFLIPAGVNLPPGLPVDFDPRAVVMARVVDDSLVAAESRIRSIIETEYGDETLVDVWEGSPAGPQPLIEESRRSVSSFSVTVNVLGVVILVASSVGIFSVMLVEVLNRMREIGLRRALGATRVGIRRFFMAQALYFSIGGGLGGVILALVFYRAVGASLAPFFETAGLSISDLSLTTPAPESIALALGAAVIMGAVFGLFPAISASRTPIVDAIRDEAA
jgi:putative ABC transport system permease protein